jgi:hypothetical protein
VPTTASFSPEASFSIPATTVIEAVALSIGTETRHDVTHLKEGGTTEGTTNHVGGTITGKSETIANTAISSPTIAPASVVSNASEEWEEIVQRFRNYCENDMNLEEVILMTRNYPDLLPGMISAQVTT